jgi:hypothetical protein
MPYSTTTTIPPPRGGCNVNLTFNGMVWYGTTTIPYHHHTMNRDREDGHTTDRRKSLPTTTKPKKEKRKGGFVFTIHFRHFPKKYCLPYANKLNE